MRIASLDRRHRLSLWLALGVLVLVVAGYFIGTSIEQNAYQETRSEMSEGFGKLPTIEYKGVTYQQRSDLTPFLIIGYDKIEDTRSGFRNGGQSDFLLLVVLDHTNKVVRQLQIDRDAMTNVVMLGITGREVGTRFTQICLAHAFGATIADNDAYTVRAVQNLLEGIPLNLSISMNLGSIASLNHVLGGVTVTLAADDDFTAYDSAMYPGATLHLTDRQAEAYVHARMDVSDGTNVSRMRRHRAYMQGAIAQLKARYNEDHEYATEFLNGIEDVTHTNMTRGRLINELNRAMTYTIGTQETLAGEHTLGDDGYVEFHVDEESVMDWVLDVFYTELKGTQK